MKNDRFDAMHVLERVFNEDNERLFYERAQDALQTIANNQESGRARIEEEARALQDAREAKMTLEQRAAKLAEKRDQYKKMLSRPLLEIIEENERLKKENAQHQQAQVNSMVTKMQFQALALEYGEALGISVEQALNERRSGPGLGLVRAVIKP